MINKIFISDVQNAENFQNQLNEFEEDKKINSVLILAGASSNMKSAEYSPILKSSSLSIIGGLFEEILFEGKRYKKGIILIGFSQKMKTLVIKDEDKRNLENRIENKFSGINPSAKTIFIFTDAFSSIKDRVLDGLYNCFGTMPNYIGGGAGSLEIDQFPCLITNEGLLDKGVVIGSAKLNSSIGVSHGWSPISEPIKVTESKDNEIISLDWKPAEEVYAKIITTHSGKNLSKMDLDSIMKSYPFGISKLDAEMVVRDPYKVENGSIFTLDKIDQGSYVQVLYGNLESLLNGASKARTLAMENKLISPFELFLIDCISRVLFMGDDFDKELRNLDPTLKGFGALTLGEIANNGDSYLEIYNKTSVVCHLDKIGK
jgi:hypothetical protein